MCAHCTHIISHKTTIMSMQTQCITTYCHRSRHRLLSVYCCCWQDYAMRSNCDIDIACLLCKVYNYIAAAIKNRAVWAKKMRTLNPMTLFRIFTVQMRKVRFNWTKFACYICASTMSHPQSQIDVVQNLPGQIRIFCCLVRSFDCVAHRRFWPTIQHCEWRKQ